MKAELQNRKKQILLCMIIGLCFMWTGSGYLSWLYNMIAHCPNINADFHSEVIGYLFQALGIGIFAILIKVNKKLSQSLMTYIVISIVDLILICTASLVDHTVPIILLGYSLNIVHGFVAGFYLSLLVQYLPSIHRGLCFGVGYAIGSLGSYLLSLIGQNNFLTSPYVFITYAAMVVLSIIIYLFLQKEKTVHDTTNYVSTEKPNVLSLIVIASLMVLLISLVKNLGFYFPMADINSGNISLEFTRLFYAIGLILAGLLNDINRKYGIFACLITLFIPFIMLLLTHQYESSLILWIISYSFTGFYTVYRVLLLGDLIKTNKSLLFISGFGLLFGRIGDALGAWIGMSLSQHVYVLICINIAFYIASAVIIMIIFEKIYIPNIIKQKTLSNYEPTSAPEAESEADETHTKELAFFDEFAKRYDLSKRETDILRLAITDMTNTTIASELFISVNTTKFHIRNILKKTGCANRNELRDLYKKR